MKLIKIIGLFLLSKSLLATPVPHHRYDPSHPQYVVVKPEALKWKQVPNLPEGISFVILEGKTLKAKGPFTIRQTLPPYTNILPHYHTSAEHLTVLSGVFCTKPGKVFDKKDGYCLPAGSYQVNPPMLAHMGWTGKEGAVVQINGVGPWNRVYIDTAPAQHHKTT
ncbi:MAG: cupin domain-containing protein [Gammaproteobacteria bacterium]|nr:cupin domain-containing protein [Gammaproteobacteria bacterium]